MGGLSVLGEARVWDVSRGVSACGGDNDLQQIASDRLGVQSDILIVRTRNSERVVL